MDFLHSSFSCLNCYTAAVTLVLIGIIFAYFKSKNDFWSSRGLPGPKWIPAYVGFGTLLQPFGEKLVKWDKEYGKVYAMMEGMSNVMITVSEPELIKAILVKDWSNFINRNPFPSTNEILTKGLFFNRGEEWKRIRSITSPTFTSGKIKRMYSLLRGCIVDLMSDLSANANSEIELKSFFGRYTVDVIATCAFGTKTDIYSNPNSSFFKNVTAILDFKMWHVLLIIFLPRVAKFFNISIEDKEAMQFFESVLKRMVAERKKVTSGKDDKYTDFLQLLVNAELDEDSVADNNYDVKGHTNKKLTEIEILAQSVQFLFAGYETTSTTLSYLFYELALNPSIQQRLYEEACSASEDGEVSYDTVNKLPYLNAAVSEILRLYNPLIALDREAKNEYILGDNILTIPEGTHVTIPVYALHHNEEYFPNPYTFDPERFMGENKSRIIPYTYLPFGDGPRQCIGSRFALLETKLAVVEILKKFQFTRNSKTQVPLKFAPLSGILKVKSIVVSVEKRRE